MKRALLSVSDKSGLIEFARALVDAGVEIISTGGTARALAESDVVHTAVNTVTGFPEIMDGRVKTLHPAVHGGILARRGEDDAVMREHGIQPIDLVVVNLYPFERVTADPKCTFEQAIENIDIGGPAMVRAAAKNHRWVGVVVDPSDYDEIAGRVGDGGLDGALRKVLARKAYAHTAAYDSAIASYLGREDSAEIAQRLTLSYRLGGELRYGENPHQQAALYHDLYPAPGSVAAARVVQGKALSFNNYADADAALNCVREFDPDDVACVIVKHANPCGVALADSALRAYDLAYATDPVSAFGGIIAFNQMLDAETAQAIVERQFVEVIIAPNVSEDAANVLATKKNVRVLETGPGDRGHRGWKYRTISGGLLAQSEDLGRVQRDDLKTVSRVQPTDGQMADLLFAWRVAKHVKSNAIVYASDRRTVGIGAGQMSRVVSARIAEMKAHDAELSCAGAVMASDAFFPFRDGIDAAAASGIAAVIQPGGSKRDDEVIAAADEHGIAMVFTGMRHFNH